MKVVHLNKAKIKREHQVNELAEAWAAKWETKLKMKAAAKLQAALNNNKTNAPQKYENI